MTITEQYIKSLNSCFESMKLHLTEIDRTSNREVKKYHALQAKRWSIRINKMVTSYEKDIKAGK